MFQKENLVKIIGGVVLLLGVVLGIWMMIPKSDIDYLSFRDRLNPFINETTSYAKVKKLPKDDCFYYNVQAINPKTGKDLSYKIKYVGGYDPDGEYISIDHKGQYVREIKYISKSKYQEAQK